MISLSLELEPEPLVWLGMYGLVARAWILYMEVVKWKTGVDQGFNWHAILEILWFKVLMIAPLKAIKFSDWGNLDAIESGISAFRSLLLTSSSIVRFFIQNVHSVYNLTFLASIVCLFLFSMFPS